MSEQKTKILMVCLGNICRSPLAEGILKNKLDSSKFKIESAGTGAYHIGKLPDVRSIAIAKENNIDITDQKAAQFKKSDFSEYDYIFVMDKSNYNNVINLAENQQDIDKVSLILNEIEPKVDAEVPDPYYGGDAGFQHVYNLLDQACENIKNKLN